MSAYKLIVFDLDGTIADTRQDLANAVNHCLRRLGRPELTVAQAGAFVGDGLHKLIERSLEATGGDLSQLETGVEEFKSFYKDHLVDTTVLYPGVAEALREIKQEMVVLTNKPRRYSTPILDHLGVRERFSEVYGGDSFPTKKPDPFALRELMKKHGAARGETVMVGDSLIDIATARAAGTPVCAVSYGFTPPQELRATHPDWLVNDLRLLAEALKR